MNVSQILDLEYPRAYSLLIKSIVDGKLLDDSRTYLFASIGIFCLFAKIISNKKEHEKGINEPMSHFDSNTYSAFKEKESGKGITKTMSCFDSNTFLESNEKV